MWKSLKSASMSRQCHCWRLAPPTTLPGHGSAFQRLPHRRQGGRGRGEGVWSFFGAYGPWMWVHRHVAARTLENKKQKKRLPEMKPRGPRPVVLMSSVSIVPIKVARKGPKWRARCWQWRCWRWHKSFCRRKIKETDKELEGPRPSRGVTQLERCHICGLQWPSVMTCRVEAPDCLTVLQSTPSSGITNINHLPFIAAILHACPY